MKFCRWIKRNFQQLSLVFWEKSNALGILQQNGLNLADLQICIFLLRTISQTETSRGTNYLLSFLPYKEGNIWKTIAKRFLEATLKASLKNVERKTYI